MQAVYPTNDNLPPHGQRLDHVQHYALHLSSFAHSSFQLVEVILHNQEEEQLRRAQKHLNREINKYITFVSQHAQHSQHHQ